MARKIETNPRLENFIEMCIRDRIVAREQVLREEIEKIVGEIEG